MIVLQTLIHAGHPHSVLVVSLIQEYEREAREIWEHSMREYESRQKEEEQDV